MVVTTDGRRFDPAAWPGRGDALARGTRRAAPARAARADQGSTAARARRATVTIELTPQGCAPKPAKITRRAGRRSTWPTRTPTRSPRPSCAPRTWPRSSASRRTSRRACPAASRSTSSPGSYKISCPGAAQPHWTLTVTGKATGAAWQSNPQLAAAVTGYSSYIDQNTAGLVSHTQAFCRAIDAGNMAQAKLLYPQARVYYERIEPVAEIWGTLDTADRRPVGEPGHGGVPVHRVPQDRAAALGGQHPGRRAEAVRRAGQARAAAADPGAQARSTTRWRWPAAPPT